MSAVYGSKPDPAAAELYPVLRPKLSPAAQFNPVAADVYLELRHHHGLLFNTIAIIFRPVSNFRDNPAHDVFSLLGSSIISATRIVGGLKLQLNSFDGEFTIA